MELGLLGSSSLTRIILKLLSFLGVKIHSLNPMEAYKRWVRRNKDYVHSLESLTNVSLQILPSFLSCFPFLVLFRLYVVVLCLNFSVRD